MEPPRPSIKKNGCFDLDNSKSLYIGNGWKSPNLVISGCLGYQENHVNMIRFWLDVLRANDLCSSCNFQGCKQRQDSGLLLHASCGGKTSSTNKYSIWFCMVGPVEPLAEKNLELELPSNYDAQKNLMRGPSSAKQQELQRTMNRSALLE